MSDPRLFNVISIFPEMFAALNYGIVRRALENNLIQLKTWNPRDYTDDPHRTVDDRPYGGGPGMVMKVEPLQRAIHAAKQASPSAKTIYLSPQGTPLTQALAAELATYPSLILLAGRYEGVDQRLIDTEVDMEVSIGDFVVSGGELPAMLLIDAITRTLPNVLGHDQSANNDSFANGLLDHPCYTRPEVFADQSVPKVLMSGDHTAIARWRLQQALGKTWQKRPDLIKRRVLNEDEAALLAEYIQSKGLPHE